MDIVYFFIILVGLGMAGDTSGRSRYRVQQQTLGIVMLLIGIAGCTGSFNGVH